MSWEHWIGERDTDYSIVMQREDLQKFANFLNIITKSRKRGVVWMRYCFWTFVKFNSTMTLDEIGGLTGGHDHATVHHGLREVRAAIQVNDAVYRQIKQDFNYLKLKYEKRNSV